MNIAYLILAHQMPEHLQKLITALYSSSSSIFIHLDKKSNANDFSSITGNNIHFTQERIAVFWNDFSQVEATLLLIRAAFANPCSFDRFVLLSGVDYPLRSASYLASFLDSNRDKEFINLVAMPSDITGKPISRLTTYVLRPGNSKISRVIRCKAIRTLLIRVGALLYKRDYKIGLGGLAPYGGSQWWALSYSACDFILTFVSRETQIVNFFKNTNCPDESFFQTILGNSTFRSKVVRNLTYADWSAGGGHPAYLTEKHLALFYSESSFSAEDLFGAGEKLFARKFSDKSEGLVTYLERQISKK